MFFLPLFRRLFLPAQGIFFAFQEWWRSTEGAARAEPNLFELCRVASEEDEVNKPNRERKIRSASRGRFFGQCNGRFGVWTTASITFAKQYPQRQGRRKEIFYIQKKTGRDGVGRCCIWERTIIDIRGKRNLLDSVGQQPYISKDTVWQMIILVLY